MAPLTGPSTPSDGQSLRSMLVREALNRISLLRMAPQGPPPNRKPDELCKLPGTGYVRMAGETEVKGSDGNLDVARGGNLFRSWCQ